MKEIKRNLANNLQRYISIILEEYASYIPKERKKYLENIKDYESCIEIADLGTISLYYFNNKIYFPTLAFSVLEHLKNNQQYRSNPNHKCFDENTLIKNQNTFWDYIKHAIIKGLSPEEYFQESLLHEAMHFCGCGGADPLKEGITELKTRELASRRNLLTSGCGYPKEIDIVLELQELFGTDTMNKIAFANSNKEISDILMQEQGSKAEELYFSVRREMKNQFSEYMNQKFTGPDAPIKKAQAYDLLDYSKVYGLIEQHKKKQELSNMVTESKEGESNAIKNKNI